MGRHRARLNSDGGETNATGHMAKIGTINKIGRCVMRNASIFILAILVGLIGSTIQAGELINYQGRLTDSDGNPVADDTYQLTFSLYDDSTGGFLQWSEEHPLVETKDGLFHVILGSVFDLDASIFEIEPLYLEIQVGVEVISPRTRLTSAPSAIIAKNMSGGDVETGEGFLRLKSSEGATAVMIGSEDRAGPAYLTMYNPDGEYSDQTLVEMKSQATGGSIEFFPAGDMPHDPAIRMGVEPTPWSPGRLEFFDPTGSLPHDPYVRMGLDPSPMVGGKLEFFDPGSGWPDDPMMVMGIEPSPFHEASFRMYNPSLDPPSKMVELTVNDATSEWGSSFSMYLIEPANDKKVLEMSAFPSTGASIKMFNPQPEPSARIMEMSVEETVGPSGDEWGSRFSMYLIEPADDKKVLEMSAFPSTGASIKMFNPQLEPPVRIMEMSVNESADEWGGYFSMYSMDPGNEGGKIFEISNTASSGASIKMFNPQPEPPRVIAEITGSYNGKGGSGQVAVYDDANHLQSFLTPAKLLLNYAFGEILGPPVFMEASASEAKVGIGTYFPSEPLVVGDDLGSLLGDWIVIGNSEAGKFSGFLAGEDLDNCGSISWHNDGNYLTLGTEDNESGYSNTLVLKAGKVGIGTNDPSEELHVVGDICYTGSIGACSDRRYKKDVQTIGDAAETLLRLRGISYSWRQDEYPAMKFDDQTHLGFVAQEIKDLVPGVVLVDDNGNMSVDYGRITPLLVEAVKGQQGQIKELNAQIADLREALGKLQATNR